MQILQANNAAYGTPVALFRDTTVSRSAQHRRVLSMGCSYVASQSVEDGFETAPGHSERAGHRNLTIFRMKDLDQHDRPFAWQTNLAGDTPPPGLGWGEESQHSCTLGQDL